jgi:hypothetical protein
MYSPLPDHVLQDGRKLGLNVCKFLDGTDVLVFNLVDLYYATFA